MIATLKRFNQILMLTGINLLKFLKAIKNFPRLIKDYYDFKRQSLNKDLFDFSFSFPILSDFYDNAGSSGGHYFYQDLYVAQRIFVRKPENHIDIGSRIDGFVTKVASYRKIKVYDIRHLELKIENIDFVQKDITVDDDELNGICDSISCLHALEHFGLGRYGDKIDYFGYLKGFKSISKMLKKNGIMYLSLPIGKQRIEFNAQRVFSISYVLKLIDEEFKLMNFSYVDDFGDFYKSVEINKHNIENNFNCNFGCGIFELKKIC